MQAVVAAGLVRQQQRRGALLSDVMTPFQESLECLREPVRGSKRLHPTIRRRRQSCVELGSQRLDERWQRRGKVLVLADAKPEPLHLDTAAEQRVVLVHRSEL